MEDRLHDGDLRVSGPTRTGLESLPVEVRERLPGLERPTPTDLQVLSAQMGRRPHGEVLISRRCPHGLPAVIMTMPSAGEGGPVPPLFWLTCPVASSRVGTLESRGSVSAARDRLDSDEAFADAFRGDEEDFSRIQMALASSAAPLLADRLEGKGAAGGAAGAVKCLHAHLAYRLSLSAPPHGAYDTGEQPEEVGVIVTGCEELLATEGGAWCERPPAACVT